MITFTPEALAQWRLEHPEPTGPAGPLVRVALTAGGCAGLKYVLEPVAAPAASDHVFAFTGLTVVCAEADLPLLTGLKIDHVDAMVGGGYRFENPNAGRSCGCGASFDEKPD